MRGVDLRAGYQRGDILRRSRTVEHCRVDGREVRDLSGRRGFQIRGHREQVVKARRIQEADLGALLRRLANAMRQHRHFAAQVGTHHQQAIELVDVGNGEATEARRGRISCLIAEIRLTQAMIDVARAQRAREFGQ